GKKYGPDDLAGAFTVWQGHKTFNGTPHVQTGNLFLNVTDRLRKAAQAPGELEVTLVPSKITPKARPRAAAAPAPRPETEEIQFRAVYLAFDGASPPHTPPAGGNHGH